MSISKYLNHSQFVFASILHSILSCAQISSEVWVKFFSDGTLLNGEIYASPTFPPPTSPLPVPLTLILPLGIGIVIGRLPPSSGAVAEAAIEALVAAVKVNTDDAMYINEKRQGYGK